MKHQSANEIIEEARQYAEDHDSDPLVFQVWVANVEKALEQHGKTADDKIFILQDDGKQYVIDPDYCDVDGAYQRAMSGI